MLARQVWFSDVAALLGSAGTSVSRDDDNVNLFPYGLDTLDVPDEFSDQQGACHILTLLTMDVACASKEWRGSWNVVAMEEGHFFVREVASNESTREIDFFMDSWIYAHEGETVHRCFPRVVVAQ